MVTPSWQLRTPLSAIIFDCDGTLSTIEGIDELATKNGAKETVKQLTAEAMGSMGMNPELYQKRLDLVQPTEEQVLALGQHYFSHRVDDVSTVIALLKKLNKSIYIVSAGLHPAVALFGELLQVPRKNIFAVDIQFDAQGNFSTYDHTSPLTHSDGKRGIVTQLKKIHPELAYVGDGLNDYVVHDLVTRFIGYGGAFYRENIAAACHYYIKTLSLAPLLPLVLTQTEYENLSPEENRLYHLGLNAIQNGTVIIH